MASALASRLYSMLQKTWAWTYSVNISKAEKAPIPVISVGAIAMGGSGKTPCAMLIAQRLRQAGFKPVISSRGYKGSYKGRFLIVSDGKSGHPLVSPEECGDEPYLMASRLKDTPVIVARKRIDAISAGMISEDCDVAILDDGFQHLRLQRETNLVLLNSGPDEMFPVGNLREPFSALDRADIILLTGPEEDIPEKVREYIWDKPLFQINQQADCLLHGPSDHELGLSHLDGRDVMLISAIANPQRFRKMSEHLGWAVRKHREFRDHHRLSDKELSGLIEEADAMPMVLTEKDWVKIPKWFRERPDTYALRISVVINRESDLIDLILDTLRKK